MKTYVSFVRDHSASMRPLVNGAANDFNLLLETLKEDKSQNIVGSVVECGTPGVFNNFKLVEKLAPISNISPIRKYVANGGSTPLWDAVGEAIGSIEQSNISSQDAFLVMVITDGEENASRIFSAKSISEKIRKLQATDRWTFVFRVPKGSKAVLTRLGIPEGNIMEWEQTEKSLLASTQATVSAVKDYFVARSAGKTAKNSFYTDLSHVSVNEVKSVLSDVSNSYHKIHVDYTSDGMQIRDFIEQHGYNYTAGFAFYQLSKPEKVQERKEIIIRERSTGKLYGGYDARNLLGLPHYGEIKLSPGDHGKYDVFIQSTSVNRKLVAYSTVLYKK